MRVKPGLVTACGLLACLLVPAFAGRGTWWSLLAAGLVAFAAVTDTVDGALAVLTAHTTRLGYVYDSVVDRIGEACWLFAMWRIGVHAWLVVAAGALSWLHEYTRARANAAGMAEIGASTLGERPTRVMLAVLGFGLAGLAGLGNNDLPAGIVTFAATVWVVLGVIGFLQLFASIHRALAGRGWPTWRPAGAAGSPPVTPVPVSPATASPIAAMHEVDGDAEVARFASMPATSAVYTSRLARGQHVAPDADD
jgi:CDP-diacylglycerol--glycerol-3-phosphate 3-phosphatidyltransferase